jgi:cytochrome P450
VAAAQDSHPANAFARAFTNAQHKVGTRLWSGPPWPLWEVFGDITRKDVETIYQFIDPILEKAFEKTASEKEKENAGPEKAIGDDEDQTLLNHLIAQTDDVKIIKDEIINILIAGRDTTTATLTCILYCLSQHPEFTVRLREEILEKVGPTQPPTYYDIKSMTYTRAVINETLRLFPPVPFNARETTRQTTWPSRTPGQKPYYLATGTTITISPWHMHRDKKLWGPDALEFDPDRFLDERLQKYLTPNPSIFVPFNGGPRLCLGREFAYNQMTIFLIRLFQTFDNILPAPHAQPTWSRPPLSWKSPENSGKRKSKEEFWPKHHLTMYTHGGLWLSTTVDNHNCV